jgi:hypothetical protein
MALETAEHKRRLASVPSGREAVDELARLYVEARFGA